MHDDEVDPNGPQDARTAARPLMVGGFVLVLPIALAVFLIIGANIL